MKMRFLFCSLCVLACTWSSALAQPAQAIVGSWKLVSASATNASGVVDKAPFGANLTGVVTYTTDGRVTVLLSYGDRKALSGSDRLTAPPAERADAFSTFFAYSGQYSIAGDRVTHHVEIASYPNWVKTDLTRIFIIEGNHLTLRTPPLSVGGSITATDLVWEKMAPGMAVNKR